MLKAAVLTVAIACVVWLQAMAAVTYGFTWNWWIGTVCWSLAFGAAPWVHENRRTLFRRH